MCHFSPFVHRFLRRFSTDPNSVITGYQGLGSGLAEGSWKVQDSFVFSQQGHPPRSQEVLAAGGILRPADSGPDRRGCLVPSALNSRSYS